MQQTIQSPYGVPVASVIPAPPVTGNTPLLPFEQRQLQNLIQQIQGAPERVQEAFYRSMVG